jgi:hypothetical protein
VRKPVCPALRARRPRGNAGARAAQDDEHPRSIAHTLRNVAAGRLRPLPPSVSPACAALVTAALAHDPCARPALAKLAGHPWLAAMAPAAAASAGMEAELLARHAAAGRGHSHSPRGHKPSRPDQALGAATAAAGASWRPPRPPTQAAAADALRRLALGSAAAAQARAAGGGCRAQAAAALRCCRAGGRHGCAPDSPALVRTWAGA